MKPQTKSLSCVLVSCAHGNYTCNHNAADNLNYHFGDVGGFPRRVFSEVMVGFVVIPVCKNYTCGCVCVCMGGYGVGLSRLGRADQFVRISRLTTVKLLLNGCLETSWKTGNSVVTVKLFHLSSLYPNTRKLSTSTVSFIIEYDFLWFTDLQF